MEFDPARLKHQLLNTGLQNKDNPLYQVIYLLIDALSKLNAQVNGIASSTTTGPTTTIIQQILGGVAFENGENNEPALLSSGGGENRTRVIEWDVLTDGDILNPEFIFAGGEVIMTKTITTDFV